MKTLQFSAGAGLALVLSLAGVAVAFGADVPAAHVHTTRPISKALPLPKGDDVFHFVVFGDRTGGPAEGIKVLAQAVSDANLLDPDLVMTVGDLVNGYNQTGEWLKQMEEYRSTMGKLRMPWFPVAGNHDIYWRPDPKSPEIRPSREHEENYEKHFGPLWYWFEHKNTGFLVLFSDEGPGDGRPRDFGDRDQQKISPTQMAWIATELEKMKRLRHVFVFLHHPYWWGERYPGSNWDDVHRLLVKNGNVRAVLAGHIHQMRYDGVRDGIGYYALAATGASLTAGMEYRYFGLLHHFNVVTVRPDGYSMASVPVGTVFDPREFTPSRMAEVESARYTLHEIVSPPIVARLDGSASATCRVALTNPCALPIEATIVANADKTWTLVPDHRHARFEPGEGRVFEFAATRRPTNGLVGFQAPEFELRFDVLAPEARLAMPKWSLRAGAQLEPVREALAPAKTNRALVLNGNNACLEIERGRIELPDGPFTVETWIRPSFDTNGAIVANLRIGGFSLEIAGGPQFRVQTDDSTADDRRFARLKPPIVIRSTNWLVPREWSHLAGVFDGRDIALFVNGRKVASTNAPGARLSSDRSMYVGARPNGAFHPHNFSSPMIFLRGEVDDIRISRGARYTDTFKPVPVLERDASTLFLLPNDRRYGPFAPADAARPFQALIHGEIRLTPASR